MEFEGGAFMTIFGFFSTDKTTPVGQPQGFGRRIFHV
jgi:hypothetical protein